MQGMVADEQYMGYKILSRRVSVRRATLRPWAAAACLLLAAMPAASAQEWARDMFDHASHDFGMVARGAKVEHRFTVENVFVEDAHIASARVSCGCTTPEVPTRILKTWEKAEVIVRVDTRAYLGQKDVTITVVFDRPFPAEVQLQIHCYIRSDVVVQPGVVQFGSVAQGTALQQRVSVSYSGRSDWQIQRVECSRPGLSAQAVETGRSGGMTNYDVVVTLAANAPPGYLHDQIYLVTNDFANPRSIRVPVPVEGVIQSGITVHPSPLYMGTVEPGKSIARQLVVCGTAPFKVVKVESNNPQFRCKPETEAGAVHRLPVTFEAGAVAGKITGEIRIETDAGGGVVAVPVNVDVVAPQTAAQPAVAKPSTTKPPETARRPKAPEALPSSTAREL